MSDRTLDAAGITDPQLRAAYEACRKLNADHGKTYYLASLLLPPAKRPHVWALYGFARYADEFVDSMTDPDPEALVRFSADFLDVLSGGAPAQDPIAVAMLNTMRRWAIPRAYVEAFLESMQMDITVASYRTYADLEHYMYGSAAVIGLQMLPVLEPLTPAAGPRARALGEAFQMTNFIRDVGEDLQRGRLYLPLEDLATFGVTRELLDSLVAGPSGPGTGAGPAGAPPAVVRELLAFEVERTRALYAFAEPGIEMLHPTSRDCMRTAFVLYSEILDAVEKSGYQVFTNRVGVPLTRRLAVALPALRRARATRRAEARWIPAAPTPS